MHYIIDAFHFLNTNPTILTAASHINVFFLFSFFGWIMECCVLTVEKRRFVFDRGFIRGPFCIIYGFGAVAGYYILRIFSFNTAVLFIAGAVCATLFELFTALLMKRVFGSFWWDYSNKPFNYKGMICLESTLAWGVIGVLIVKLLFSAVWNLASRIPSVLTVKCAAVLVIYYAVDFAFSVRRALVIKARRDECAVNLRESI